MIDKKQVSQLVVDWWCSTEGRAIVCDKKVWDYIISDENGWAVSENSQKIETISIYNYMKFVEPSAPERLQGFVGGSHMMVVIDRCADPRCIEVLMGTDAILILT